MYALSIFQPEARFTSAIALAQQLVKAGGAANGTAAPAAAAAAAAAAVVDNGNGNSNGGSSGGGYSQRQVDSYVHLLYGLSKDWCGSGLRVGVLYSRNQRLHQVGGWEAPSVLPPARRLPPSGWYAPSLRRLI